MIGAVTTPSSGEAHSFLVRTSPEPGARLTNAPAEIVLDFTEPVEAGPVIEVRDRRGQTVAPVFVVLDVDTTRVRASLPELADDVYQVTWRVAASDEHRTEGEFAFAVGVSAPPGVTTVAGSGGDQALRWVDAAAALGLAGGLAVAGGGLVSELLVWRRRATLAAPVLAGLLITAVGATSTLALSLSRAGTLANPGGWGDTLAGRSERYTMLILMLAVAAIPLVRHLRLRLWALGPVVLAITLLVVRGHAGQSSSWWSAPATTAHVLVGGAWVGALIHLARTARTTQDGDLEPGPSRYARLAVWVVAATIALGTVAALAQLDRPGQLIDSTYGRILVIKLVLLSGALTFAVLARRRGLPATGARIARLARLTRLEAGAVIAVLAVSALLASTAPPAPNDGIILGPAPMPDPTVVSADLAGSHMVLAAAATDRLLVRVFPPGEQPTDDLDVVVAGRNPDGGTFDLLPRPCGAGCLDIAHPWPAGITTLDVTVSNPAGLDGSAEVAIAWPPSPDASDLLAQAVAATRAKPRAIVTETVTSGPGMTSGPYPLDVSGAVFIASQPYADGADDVHRLPDADGLKTISFVVSGSDTWHQLWLDPQDRIRREVLIDPGHRVEHTIEYPEDP
ncbi:MAG: copper resistance protein CopC [Actinomycetota bacterium]|nr:copper resistance protein CopC [Actinomycetota bacterium]